jgi:hypothetical protein
MDAHREDELLELRPNISQDYTGSANGAKQIILLLSPTASSEFRGGIDTTTFNIPISD